MNLMNGFLITCKATLLVCFTSHIQMDNAMINIHMDKDKYFYATLELCFIYVYQTGRKG